jgi:hypothetical protein
MSHWKITVRSDVEDIFKVGKDEAVSAASEAECCQDLGTSSQGSAPRRAANLQQLHRGSCFGTITGCVLFQDISVQQILSRGL